MPNVPNIRSAVEPAAAAFLDVLGAVPDDELAAPTPCEDYAVRDLLNHLMYWAPYLIAAARKEQAAPQAGERDVDLVKGEWRLALKAGVTELAEALREPSAWEGVTTFGSVDLPAERIGSMALTEFVVHGWDLAVATGVEFRCEPATAKAVEGALAELAPQGRGYGVFGAEIAVPETAVPLARVLGLSGRDPDWSR